MNAGPSPRSLVSSPDACAVIQELEKPPAPLHRVVSVSARQPPDAVVAKTDPRGELFLTPRVINQRSFDALSSRMRQLIDEAGRAADGIADATLRAERAEAQTGESTAQLQERLRLGARMLKAFQGQIERIDAVLGQVEARRLDAVQAEERLSVTLARFESVAAQAMSRLEQGRGAPQDGASEQCPVNSRGSEDQPANPRRDLEAVARRLEALLDRIGGGGTSLSARSARGCPGTPALTV